MKPKLGRPRKKCTIERYGAAKHDSLRDGAAYWLGQDRVESEMLLAAGASHTMAGGVRGNLWSGSVMRAALWMYTALGLTQVPDEEAMVEDGCA